MVRDLNLPGNYKLRIIEELKKSSYAARNLGVQESVRSQYVVFIDTIGLMRKDWLCKGIQTMEGSERRYRWWDMEFKFSDRPSSAEIVDSFTNLQMQHGIEVGGYCRTANLFVKRSVFDTIGFFREVQSGEDIRWTKKATDSGLKLVFAKDAVVAHPARGWRAMIKKQLRVGMGKMPFCVHKAFPFSGSCTKPC